MSTKERILDAAEHLFSEHGFADTSLRSITAEAGANLAAVNYYFQSKDVLLQAVFARRVGPINQRRLEMLEAAEARAGDGPLPVEDVLRAFVEPVLKMPDDPPDNRRSFGRLLGRIYTEPGGVFGRILKVQFGAIKDRFRNALERALPGLPQLELYWRIHFLIGTLAHTVAGVEHLEGIFGGVCDASDTDAVLERLLTFVAAGFQAPLPCRGGSPCELK